MAIGKIHSSSENVLGQSMREMETGHLKNEHKQKTKPRKQGKRQSTKQREKRILLVLALKAHTEHIKQQISVLLRFLSNLTGPRGSGALSIGTTSRHLIRNGWTLTNDVISFLLFRGGGGGGGGGPQSRAIHSVQRGHHGSYTALIGGVKSRRGEAGPFTTRWEASHPAGDE